MVKTYLMESQANGVQISEIKPRHIYAHPEYAYLISEPSDHMGPPKRGGLNIDISLCRFNGKGLSEGNAGKRDPDFGNQTEAYLSPP